MMPARLADLELTPMVSQNEDPYGTSFHVSVDARERTSTGISASDRARTIRALADMGQRAEAFNKPGHVFPLAYAQGGVLRRAGHTEASVDLMTAAGLSPTAVICEIARADGEMARFDELERFAREHGLHMLAISDLIAYRRSREKLVSRVCETRMPLVDAQFTALGYRDLMDGREHMALVLGRVAGGPPPLVRMHSECLTGDVFGSRRCDCGRQLELSLELIAAEGRGVVVYLRGHEGRGIGLVNKLHAYRLQDQGLDTVEANLAIGEPVDRRDYGVGMQILDDLGVRRMRLLTNNPSKRAGLEGFGLEVVERVPLITVPTEENVRYLRVKQEKLGHLTDHA
jgi:3,4-dihydroxy 2-butanone 4-phosphate synthase/GTP cyclohydrolase II